MSVTLIDEDIFATETVHVGRFRCPVAYPSFADCGRPSWHMVVFPRTGVWIQHAVGRAFVADPSVATVYYPGQEYRRRPLCPDGDRSDWFAVSPAVALEITHHWSATEDAEPLWPFRAMWVRSDIRLYARQRALYRQLCRGELEPLDAEERVIGIVASVVAASCAGSAQPMMPPRAVQAAHRDLATRAQALLARDVTAPTRVSLLAAALGTSPYHLCRVFRQQTGTTLHRYRLDLRLRIALERLAQPGATLSQVALGLGFCSHSHFTAALREHLGLTPSQVREALRHGPLLGRLSTALERSALRTGS